MNQSQPYLQRIDMVLIQPGRHPICPPVEQVFRAFQLTPLDNVKVVIIGQDPYHQPGMANGLAFSTTRGYPVPKSLENVYSVLARSIPGFQHPGHGDLTEWALQGVLLINSSLTVRQGTPRSHGDIWKGFIIETLRHISAARGKKCVYLLWGRQAQDMAIHLLGHNHIRNDPHPAARKNEFLRLVDDPFTACNKLLVEEQLSPINWQISP
jgi:uracil-DNA glycosylase